jgi:hypothetical protein
MKLYELQIEDKEDEVFAISLVENPAIQSDFMYFHNEKELIKFAAVDNEKRTLIGPILIPDKRIIRVDAEGEPYEVFFTKDTVSKLAQNYLMKKYTDSATLEHDAKIKGVHLVESWIKDGQFDKSNNFGLSLPKGTWVGMFKITDDKIWNDYVKTGKVKGFSIEGLFSHKLVKASMIDLEKDIEELSENEVEVLLGQIKAIIKKDKRFGKGQRIEMESYADYGSGISSNAKKGIDLNEKNGNKCATQTGKVRAQQLAKGQPISVETIKRMYSYLSRAEAYYDESDMNACGTISYLLWGGKAGLGWSRNKLRELGLLQEAEAQPSIPNSSYPGEVASGSIAPALLNEEEGNIDVFGLETEYFYMCPVAVQLFTHLTSMPMDEDTKGMVRSAALQADRVFDIEEDVIEDGVAEPKDLAQAIQLVADFKDLMGEIDKIVGMKHDVSFMDGHIKIIKDLLNGI